MFINRETAKGLPYTEDLSFQEAITTYLDGIEPQITNLKSLLDQKDPEGVALYETLLNIEEETRKMIYWYEEG